MNHDNYLTSLMQILSYKSNEFATHQPVLWTYLNETEGPVLELGSGYGSTMLLHIYCQKMNRILYTVDDNPAWLNKFTSCASDMHRFVLLNKIVGNHEDASHWISFLNREEIRSAQWGLVFIDQSPWEARYHSAEILKNNAQILIIHDCDYYPENNKYFGKVIQRLQPYSTEGEYDFSDMFKYSQVYFPKKPWPAPTGPPTLAGSQTISNLKPVKSEDFEKKFIQLAFSS